MAKRHLSRREMKLRRQSVRAQSINVSLPSHGVAAPPARDDERDQIHSDLNFDHDGSDDVAASDDAATVLQRRQDEARVARALADRLFLIEILQASPWIPPQFAVLGASANVYYVTLGTTCVCTCPDQRYAA